MVYGNMLGIHELMTDEKFLQFIEEQPDDTADEMSAEQLYSAFLKEESARRK